MVNSRRKGAEAEVEVAHLLNSLFPTECYRSQQFSGTDGVGDVKGLPGVHIEVKRTQQFRLWDAMKQAHRDAAETDVPIVIHRRDNEQWVAVVKVTDLPRLAEQLYLTLYSGGPTDEPGTDR